MLRVDGLGTELRLAAVVPVGLEDVAAGEMCELGLGIDTVHGQQGLVSWRGTAVELMRANLRLRTVERIIVRLGDFRARGFAEFRRKAARLPWELFLSSSTPVVIRATSRGSRLYHERALAQRLMQAMSDRLGAELVVPEPDRPSAIAAQLILLRVERNRCELSIDSTGDLLHRRGYRLATAKAPLRPTLAAALLRWSAWERNATLVDPFCGAGTIPIEAAGMAYGVTAGARRPFAFERWPALDFAAWEGVRGEPRNVATECRARIYGRDRDEGAIRAARDNAARAEAADQVEFQRMSISELRVEENAPGWIVSNPPYGRRIEEAGDLRDLYARFGQILRERLRSWKVAILCPHPALAAAVGLPWEIGPLVDNGGIKVRLLRATVD